MQEPWHLLSYDCAFLCILEPLHPTGVEKAYLFFIHFTPEVTLITFHIPGVKSIMWPHFSANMVVVKLVGGVQLRGFLQHLPKLTLRFGQGAWTFGGQFTILLKNITSPFIVLLKVNNIS